ncbi:MAG: hypothetical protein LBB85_05620 [Dysgonamonadaceae bacterium]|jgi:hypothetical protein|nr:hypothetical protein [Dysgonamonadaceae bacterium]
MNVLILSLIAFLVNIPLGKWRGKYKKLTWPWWLIIHASIPLIIPLRICLFNTPNIFIPLFITLAVLGQFIGAKTGTR